MGLLIGFVTAIQILRDRFFNDYADGFTGDKWDVSMSYNSGEKVRYIDHSVYECINDSAAGILPTNILYWVKIQEIYIGVRERSRYNSRKMLLEFILNKWFEVDALPSDQIYITNNQTYFLSNNPTFGQNNFTIFVPLAVFNLIDADPTNAENTVRSIANKYVLAGINYNVETY